MLGLLLCLLFLNDLPDVLMHDNVGLRNASPTLKIYADDIKAYYTVRTAHDAKVLPEFLNVIGGWCYRNQLKLSTTKCSVLHIGRNNQNWCYRQNNIPLASQVMIKDLLVRIDCLLTFDQHISKMVAEAHHGSACFINSL